MLLSCLFVAPAGSSGRGVFTAEDIAANTLVETSPVIVMSGEERKLLDQTLLHDYIFEWGDDRSRCCMALGYVPLYNHASPSNCEYEMDYENEVIHIRTVRPVSAGQELFINYNGDWDNTAAVWFDTQ